MGSPGSNAGVVNVIVSGVGKYRGGGSRGVTWIKSFSL